MRDMGLYEVPLFMLYIFVGCVDNVSQLPNVWYNLVEKF